MVIGLFHVIKSAPQEDRLAPGRTPPNCRNFAEHFAAATEGGPPSIAECGVLPPIAVFRRDDVNLDGALDVSDAVFLLLFLFVGPDVELRCQKSADFDDSGKLNVTDAIYILSYLFVTGLPPAEPFSACGRDPTPDALSCEAHPSCG